MLRNTIRIEFDRLYTSAMANLAQGNDLVAKNQLQEAAGKLRTLLLQAEENEREAFQLWLMDIGAQVEKIRIRIENDATKSKVMEKLGISEKSKESKVKPFLVETPDVTFEDVAGMYEVKEVVRDKVIYPRVYPRLYETFRKSSGGGVLLYGLPGTGKTMVAKAIAKETGAKFFTVKPSDLLSKWLGSSEKNVRKLFSAARSEKNAVIFFDEIEGFAASRDGDNDSVNRVVGELLTQMQGVTDDADSDRILLIAATNRPWDIDSAFLRPGRFDERIYVALPDLEARKIIVKNALLGIPGAEEIDVDKIAAETDGFNGADVAYVCEKAKEFAIRRIIGNKMKDKHFVMDDFEKALKMVRSSVSPKDVEALEKWRKEKDRNASG